MRKWKWLLAVLALPLIWLMIVLSLRAIGPSEEQRAAVALMSAAPFEIKRDAFAALWLMPYDVPEAELDAVAQRDIDAFNKLIGTAQVVNFQSLAGEHYAKLPDWHAGMPEACQAAIAECRDYLRAHPEEAAAWVDPQQKRLHKIEALAEYDGISLGFQPSLASPFPPFGGIQPVLAASTLVQFDRGEQLPALDRLCRNAQTWRRLGAHSNNLIGGMIGIAYVRQSAEWISAFLAELPPSTELPSSCVDAFALPQLSDVDLCGAMQGEWRYISGGILAHHSAQPDGLPARLTDTLRNLFLFDASAVAHLQALRMAHSCRLDRDALMLDPADIPLPPLQHCRWYERAHNWIGCSLVEIGSPIDSRYQARALDHGARLRLMAGLLWWRAQADSNESPAIRLARMPKEFFSAARPIKLVDEGRALRIQNFDQSKDAYWQVPLPASTVVLGVARM